MTTIPYILATAGHVDHGKSALARALTGTDPDRLPEEKARGITIDLGFARLRLPSPAGAPPAEYEVGIVDVPGHEDFVKNMVAGIGSIDVALIVVAADDLWMPQTEEHLQILTYLGVTRAVVVLSKIDLAPSAESAAWAIRAVRRELRGSPFADAPVVGTSATSGRGLDDLRRALAGVLAGTPPQPDVGKPRLPVDRAFALKGVGTVVTGTLTGGRFHRGQAVAVYPGGRPARVRAVQTHGREAESCPPGSRVALNLPDLAVDAGRAARTDAAVRRGDVVAAADVGCAAGRTFDVCLERSPRHPNGFRRRDGERRDGERHDGKMHDGEMHVGGGQDNERHDNERHDNKGHDGGGHDGGGHDGGAEVGGDSGGTAVGPRGGGALKDGSRVHVHHGSGDYAATLVLAAPDGLPTGGRGLAQLRFDEDVFAFAGDRFIVRDWAARHTLAGGTVLDPAAAPRGFRTDARRAFLSPRAADPRSPLAFVVTQAARDGAARRPGLLAQSRFGEGEISAAVARLSAEGKIVAAGDVLIDAARWRPLRRLAAAAIVAEHETHPESQGLKLADLRGALAGDLPEVARAAAPPPANPAGPRAAPRPARRGAKEGAADVFDALIAEMCAPAPGPDGVPPAPPEFVRNGAAVRRAGHRPALPAPLRVAGARLRAALAVRPFEPPSRKELTTTSAAGAALRFLIETGEAVAVGDELVLSAVALGRAKEVVAQYILAHGPATASELRQALGSTRRVVMPLLEYCDALGLTLRRGDVRLLKLAPKG